MVEQNRFWFTPTTLNIFNLYYYDFAHVFFYGNTIEITSTYRMDS